MTRSDAFVKLALTRAFIEASLYLLIKTAFVSAKSLWHSSSEIDSTTHRYIPNRKTSHSGVIKPMLPIHSSIFFCVDGTCITLVNGLIFSRYSCHNLKAWIGDGCAPRRLQDDMLKVPIDSKQPGIHIRNCTPAEVKDILLSTYQLRLKTLSPQGRVFYVL